jgi:hypothetical protein
VKWTALVLLGAFLLVMAYDLVMLLIDGATVSQTIWTLTHDHPIIALLLGIALGHSIWGIYPGKTMDKTLMKATVDNNEAINQFSLIETRQTKDMKQSCDMVRSYLYGIKEARDETIRRHA